MSHSPERPYRGHCTISRRTALQTLMAAFIPPIALNHAPLADGVHPASKLDLLVAGPPAGFLDQWGAQLATELQRNLGLAQPVHQEAIGGADGLTGANRFEARAAPDGSAALLLPGAAALAWLCGDSKVQFDIGTWTPMFAATAPCIIAGRPDLARLPEGRRVRAAASRATGYELPMLLALDQLGMVVQPVFGLESDADIAQAFADRSVDLVFLRGAKIPQSLAGLHGAQPLVALHTGMDQSSSFPSLPTYEQLKMLRPTPADDLDGALQSVMLASALDAALMLPQLVPAPAMAQWHNATQTLLSSLSIRAYAANLSEQLAAGTDAATLLKPLQADSATQLKLRKWLATRLMWKAG